MSLIFGLSIAYAAGQNNGSNAKPEAVAIRPVATQIASAHPIEDKTNEEASRLGTTLLERESLKRSGRRTSRETSSTSLEESSRLIPIVNQKDIRPKDQKLLSDILNWMTPLCRQNLKNLVVRYDRRADRGQSTSSTVLLRGGMQHDETIAVMIHECGHIVDLGAYKGMPSAETSNFPDGPTPTYNDDPSILFYQISWQNPWKKKMESSKEDFVSGYAMTDPWEDVAESIVYYALHEDVFRRRAENNEALMKKLNWVETYVFGEEFETAPASEIDESIVWDVTKLVHGLAF